MPTYEFQCPVCKDRWQLTCSIKSYEGLTAKHLKCNSRINDQVCRGTRERVFTPTAGIVKGASARNNYGLKS